MTAAAALYALENHVDRLALDHEDHRIAPTLLDRSDRHAEALTYGITDRMNENLDECADGGQRLRLYRDLADWYPLLTPGGEETEICVDFLLAGCMKINGFS